VGYLLVFARIFLLMILIFKGLTAQRLYKSFGVKGLMQLRTKAATLTVAASQLCPKRCF
jgi:hypothetical protein